MYASSGHLDLDGPIDPGRGEEDHRVGFSNGDDQQALGLIGIRRNHDLETGNVGKDGLHTLRAVLQRAYAPP